MITELGLSEIGGELVPPKSIIISTRAPIGNIGIAGVSLCFNQGCKAVFANDKIYFYKFVYYCLLSSKVYLQSLGKGTTFTELSAQSLKDFGIPSTSLNEQTSIANYLDAKTEQIDKLIANKQHLIALLKEERTAIINEAVSGKGKNWERKKLKYVAAINTPKASCVFDKKSEQEVVFLPMEKVSEQGKINQENKRKINDVSSGFTYFEKGDVILAKITPCFENGKSAILNELKTDFGYGSTEFHTLRVTSKILNSFLFLVLKSNAFMQTGEAFMTGAAGQKRVPTSFVEDFIIGLPTIMEQKQIVHYITDETNKIDHTISKIETEIHLIQEYRTSLISEVVTGKIKVSDINITITIPTKQTALAAEIMSQLYEEPSFGRVKFQKILYLCEYAALLEEFGSNYRRAAAGPLDEDLLSDIEEELKQLQWIDTISAPSNKYKERIVYSTLRKLQDYQKWYAQYWSEEDEAIQRIIGLLRFANTEKCEMTATLFAAWNDLIIKGITVPDDDTIIQEVFNWHESKKRLPKEDWQKELNFMRKQHIVPKGFGKPTIAA